MSSAALFDVHGRPYSRIMLPETRRGVAPPNKGLTFPAEVYTRAEINAVLAVAGRGYSGARSRAAIILGWRCGLRAAEVLDLDVSDLDFDRGTVTVRRGKGAKRRVVGIDAQAAAVVQDWIAARRRLGVPRGRKLFCTFSKGSGFRPWGYPSLADRMRELGEKSAIDKRLHFHGLRHSFAVDLLLEGVDPLQIMKALGHNDLATTMRYLDHLMPGQVVDTMRARVWPEVGHQQLTVDDVLADVAA